MFRPAALVLVLVPAVGQPCITIGAGKAPITVASETAILTWDPATKIERFTRTAEFRSDGSPVGFLVPTPTPPKLSAIDGWQHDMTREKLEEAVRPRYEDRKRPVYRLSEDWNLLPETRIAAKQLGTAALMYRGDVDVFSRSRVGGYDTAVLRAKDPQSLLLWLKANGFESDARLADWLKPYTEKGWAITAFRFASKAKSFTSEPVELAFKTDRPFYPYREPAAENAPVNRTLRLFVVTPGRVAGRVSGGEWNVEPEFSGPLPSQTNAFLGPLLKLPGDVTTGFWVTSFLDPTRVRPDSELTFVSSSDAKPVEPPPVVRWVDDPVYLPKGAVAMGVGTLGLVGGFLVRRRRKPRTSRRIQNLPS